MMSSGTAARAASTPTAPNYSAQVRYVGYDLHTGEPVKEIKVFDARDEEDSGVWRTKVGGIGHHRCHRGKATTNYLLSSTVGIEYVDPRQGTYLEHHWVRGACLYGILPANGLTYATPHPCGCFIKAKLSGFVAMSPTQRLGETHRTGSQADQTRNRTRFSRTACDRNPITWTIGPPTVTIPRGVGPRRDSVPATLDAEVGSFPAFRIREGFGRNALAADGGRRESLRRQSRIARTRTPWMPRRATRSGKYTAGGRIDSPPTIYRGLAIFGCADGCVYCLTASDGTLRWKFRAAPADVRLVSYGQLESPWPVPGSVLVVNGIVYCAAGRTAYLDGGIEFCRLAAGIRQAAVRDERLHAGSGHRRDLARVSFPEHGRRLQDILSSDGQRVYMRHKPFELDGRVSAEAPDKHVFSSAGFLDDSWWHRTYWAYGTEFLGGFGGWQSAGTKFASGRILCVQGDKVYGLRSSEAAIRPSDDTRETTISCLRPTRHTRSLVTLVGKERRACLLSMAA